MFRKTNLTELMREELPPISYQKRLCYRTDRDEVIALYHLINKTIFNNKLVMPEIEVMPRCRKYWGMCYGSLEMPNKTTSFCKIRLMDKWYCKQWLITVLAHEMCHQYQWDVQGLERLKRGRQPLMSHGPSFFVFRDKLKKHGISLKGAHSKRKWFWYQNLFKA
jgi:hypothetical protein